MGGENTNYGIPDPKLGWRYPRVEIKAAIVKNKEPYGPKFKLHWEGDDCGKGIIYSLNKDSQLGDSLIDGYSNIVITPIGI